MMTTQARFTDEENQGTHAWRVETSPFPHQNTVNLKRPTGAVTNAVFWLSTPEWPNLATTTSREKNNMRGDSSSYGGLVTR